MASPRLTRATHDHCESRNHSIHHCPARATLIVRGHFGGVSFVCGDHLAMADWGRVLWTASPEPERIITRKPRARRVAA